MNTQPKIYNYEELKQVADRIKDDLRAKDFVLLFAYNRVGKTRLSMEFKDLGRVKDEDPKKEKRNTLYFNAFTEDLFVWDNDLKGDSERLLRMNYKSRFVAGFKGRDLKLRINKFLQNYTNFDFEIIEKDKKDWEISFSRMGKDNIRKNNIKISRGEQNLFIWCAFLVAVEFVLDKDESYKGIKYIYIDDPVSSLDDNNAIAVACDIVRLLKKDDNKKAVKTVVSSHHGLFFNTMWNELKSLKAKRKTYFYHRSSDRDIYKLQNTDDKPFSYHLAMLAELQNAIDNKTLRTYHFNIMRGILETTAIFFGHENFSDCIYPKDKDDEGFHARALNLLSHGNYPVYIPNKMVDDTEEIFVKIFNGFMAHYKFNLHPFFEEQQEETQT